MWFLTQHRRRGLRKAAPDYLAVAAKINQVELYREAASQVNVPPLLRSPSFLRSPHPDGGVSGPAGACLE